MGSYQSLSYDLSLQDQNSWDEMFQKLASAQLTPAISILSLCDIFMWNRDGMDSSYLRQVFETFHLNCSGPGGTIHNWDFGKNKLTNKFTRNSALICQK